MRLAENNMSLSHNFCPLVWHFSHLLLCQYWCFFGWSPWVSGFILTIWTHSPCEVVKLKLMRYISPQLYQNLEIPGFGVPHVWPIIFHQHTDITTWNKPNITCKIFEGDRGRTAFCQSNQFWEKSILNCPYS